MAYATLNDLCCTVSDDRIAEKLLDRASRLIDDECGVEVDPDSARDVCAAMVERALIPMQSDVFGLSSASMSAGGYQQTLNYINSSGEIYLLDKERERLRGSDGTICFI